MPDYAIVLPWHFKESIISREQKYLEAGGKLLFFFLRFILIVTMIDLIIGWPGQDAIYLFKEIRANNREVNLISSTHFLPFDGPPISTLNHIPYEKIFAYDYDSIYFLQAYHYPMN